MQWVADPITFLLAILSALLILAIFGANPILWYSLPVLACYFLVTNITVKRSDEGITVTNGLFVTRSVYFTLRSLHQNPILDSEISEPFLSDSEKQYVNERINAFGLKARTPALVYQKPFEKPSEIVSSDLVAKVRIRTIDEA